MITKYIYQGMLLLALLPAVVYAQVGIETTIVRGSGILDFPVGTDKGIIIPIVNSTMNPNPSLGTIIMSDNIVKGVISNEIVEFSDVGDTSTVTFNSSDPGSMGVKSVIIGNNTSSVEGGALVLESTDKALILPHVSNVVNMPSPYPGTICYDVNSKSFAVFDGKVWNFWK